MDLKLTPDVLRSFKDKDSHKERFRSLYEKFDFLPAYAEHTNLRVKDNPKGAIGREDEWESHGKMQLAFMVSEGLRPSSTLLDIGCGVGRAARKFVPYLEAGNYVGIDISEAALNHAIKLAADEGWEQKGPTFLINSDIDLPEEHGPFDFMWAHSVYTHLPAQQIEVMIGNAAKRLKKGGRFCFTYKPAEKPRRTGLKQFGYPLSWFLDSGRHHSLHAEGVAKDWPAGQKTVRLTKL